MAWCHDISRQSGRIREMIPDCTLSKEDVLAWEKHLLRRWLLMHKKRMFQVLAQCLSKESLLTQRGCKISVILNIKRPKGLSSLFLPLFWLLMDYETSERTTGLLLVIRSWSKVWCADVFVTFLLVLLGLIWLTHEALCIAHSLTKTEKRPAEQINWNTVVCISLQHHLSAL